MSPIRPHDDEEGMGMENAERVLPLIWELVRGVARVVMWAAACVLIVLASIDGIFNDRYAQAGFELALVVVFLLLAILDALVKR